MDIAPETLALQKRLARRTGIRWVVQAVMTAGTAAAYGYKLASGAQTTDLWALAVFCILGCLELVRTFHALRGAARSFGVNEKSLDILPARVATEDFGDYLEIYNLHRAERRFVRAYACIGRGIISVGVNSVIYLLGQLARSKRGA